MLCGQSLGRQSVGRQSLVRKLTITHFNAARKSVCVEALKCVLNSLPQIKATCHGITLDMGAT